MGIRRLFATLPLMRYMRAEQARTEHQQELARAQQRRVAIEKQKLTPVSESLKEFYDQNHFSELVRNSFLRT